MRRIITCLGFDIPSDLNAVIDNITVNKVDFFPSNNEMQLFISDLDLVEENVQSSLITYLENRISTKVKLLDQKELFSTPSVIPDEEDFYSMIAPEVPGEFLVESEKKAAEEDKNTHKEQVKDKDSWEYKAKEKQKEQKEQNPGKSFTPVRNAEALFGKVKEKQPTVDILNVAIGSGLLNVEGRIILDEELRLTKTGRTIIAKFIILDNTGGINAIMFLKPEEADAFEKQFKKGGFAGFQGEPQTDLTGSLQLKVNGIYEAIKPEGRKDQSPIKRVELHCHTKMSEKDATSSPEDIIKLADAFGMSAVAITDHGVVQGFTGAYTQAKAINKSRKEKGISPLKVIPGCEGYLVDDGPTVCYNLPFDESNSKSLGLITSISIESTGDDSCKDLITKVAASKYRLVSYMLPRAYQEGESDDAAMEFSSKDIDKSLWNEDEVPDTLKDNDNTSDEAISYIRSSIINEDIPNIDIHNNEDEEVVPSVIVYEHVADFYSTIEDKIYPGEGEPSDSYFKMGELIEFIGESYITGKDIFNTLDFLRRAGFGINIEDHKYYRHKFLMPLFSIDDFFSSIPLEENVTKELLLEEIMKSLPSDDNGLLNEAKAHALLAIKAITLVDTVNPYEINKKAGHHSNDYIKSKNGFAYHIIFLCRNNLGLYNLYRLISESHINYFYKRPRVPKSMLQYFSSSIVVGGACERGEIYNFVHKEYLSLGRDKNKVLESLRSSDSFGKILKIYDYIEVQPLTNNMFMTREAEYRGEVLTPNDIMVLNELLIELADIYDIPCVATTDSHFLSKEDGKYRKMLLKSMEMPGAENQPDLYFRNTEEMLKEFNYLEEDKAYEIVVTNTNRISDLIEFNIKPFPDGTYPPKIKRSEADVRDISYTKANLLYRHNGVLDEYVRLRLEKELNSIISHGFAIMYYIAYRLVKKSNNDGYIVGSRGSVGSSLIAFLCGISEVNPLPPHYRCPICNYVEFDNSGKYGSGYDLPEKKCPHCDKEMKIDGQDIPFETFLGFNGDKEPDIDLNFSSEYQPHAHKYIEYLFGKTHTFRAGTVGTFASKNAAGVVLSVAEKEGKSYSSGMVYYLSEGIEGVKRTTSQHPGGIVVIPKEMDVYEFTPIQCPANKVDGDIITTHYDFHAMHDTILKLDVLGHADPTVLRMLNKLTDVEITSIPIPDKRVMSLLKSTDELGFPLSSTEAGSATLGLSELGTNMARGMINEAKPSSFYDLVQLMGLSHGTDVWTGNAQDLIRDGICDLNSVIGCRDSIMTQLIYWGLPNFESFDIMEKVRKGKGIAPEREALMREKNVPDWYINSCKKIKYMFPKAHAAAYSISTLRVAWFKVYYPEEYYCSFLTIRGDEFSANHMCQGVDALRNHRLSLQEKMRSDKDNPKLKNEFYLTELVEEMYHRGIEFVPIDLNTSHGTHFVKVGEKRIIPPLNSIDSISSSMGEAIYNARKDGEFKTKDDILNRTKIGKAALQILEDYGLIKGLPDSSQISMFDMF